MCSSRGQWQHGKFLSLLKGFIDNWNCQAYWEEFHTSVCLPLASENHLQLLLILHFTGDLHTNVNHHWDSGDVGRIWSVRLFTWIGLHSPPQIPFRVLWDHWDQIGLPEVLAQCCVIGSNQWDNRTAAWPQHLSPVKIPPLPNSWLSSGPPCSAAHIPSPWLVTKSCSRLDAAQQYHVS